MNRRDTISDLRLSAQRVGRLYPVLVDKHGNIVDGNHRLVVDPTWPKVELENVRTEEDRLIVRLITNVCRRNVSAKEKSEMLEELARIYLNEGTKPGKLAHKIAEKTGMSYRWAMKYLPAHLKERPGIGGPSRMSGLVKCKSRSPALSEIEVARCATALDDLVQPNEMVLNILKYTNTNFVSILLERDIYMNFEEVAGKLGVKTEVIIGNALLSALQRIEGLNEQLKVVTSTSRRLAR